MPAVRFTDCRFNFTANPTDEWVGYDRGPRAGIPRGVGVRRPLRGLKQAVPGGHSLITCFLRYTINPDQLPAFEHYARVWMRLIEKYGGTHHGYFIPGDGPPAAEFSFPGIGEAGPDNVAVALFSFPSVEAYERYRREVKNDPECAAITHHYEQTKCFTKYERVFMRSVTEPPEVAGGPGH